MRLSCQLYTLRDQLDKDPIATFESLGRSGIKYVETAGYGTFSPSQLKTIFDDLGMKVSASHIGLSAMEDDMDKVIEDSKTLGVHTIVVPWLEEKDRHDFASLAKRLEPLAQKATQAGFDFAYHNHDFEFKGIPDSLPIDLLYQAVPQLKAQFDLGWIHYAGYSPAEYLAKYAGRVDSVHLKDSKKGHDVMDLAPGEGELDYPELISAAEKAGAKFATVEIDQPRGDALDVVLTAISKFNSLGLR